MSYKWLPEEEHLLKLLRATNSIPDIAKEFAKRYDEGLPGFRYIRTVKAIERKCESSGITKESCKGYSKQNDYSDRFKQLTDLQSEFQLASEARTRGLVGQKNIARKILSMSDIHFPFARNDLLELILDEHEDADIVVLNGDILEGYMFSTFEKNKRVSAAIEYRAAFDFIHMLSERFPAVYLVDGNHDVRVARALKRSGFVKEQTQILRPNLIARIANGEKLDETGMLVDRLNFSNVYYEQRESWYIRIGKTLFVHPFGNTTSAPGYKVKKVNERFRERYAREEYDSVICGHTHQIYKGIVNSRLLVEQGCLAGVLGYANGPDFKYNNSPMNGYAVVYQDENGNTDFNWSGPVFLGEVFPPKKSVLT